MAGEMRFGEQIETRHAAGIRERVPLRHTERVQVEFLQQPIAKILQLRAVAEAVGVAVERLDDPLDADERRCSQVHSGLGWCDHASNHEYYGTALESTREV